MAKDQFNQQVATFKLREPINEGRVMFTIDDEKIDQLFNKKYEEDVDYIHDGPDVYYITDQNDLQKFVDYVESMGLDANRIHVHEYFKEDMGGNVTSGGEAYLPALNVPSKKQNPFKEDVLSGYTQDKNFRPGHTKDTGGFQYKDLWGLNENKITILKEMEQIVDEVFSPEDYRKVLQIIDKIKYTNTRLYNSIMDMVDDIYPHKYGEVESIVGINEAFIPDNVMSFAKRKGVTALVKKVAGWAQKAGKRIVGGTAIGKGYNTLILDLTYQGGEIRINLEEETISVNGEDYIYDYDEFVNALGTINENYSRFRNETKTRTKPEQFHEAVKSVKRKIQEINKLYEYMERLKLELSEDAEGLKYKKYTENAIIKIKEAVKTLNIKTRKLK